MIEDERDAHGPDDEDADTDDVAELELVTISNTLAEAELIAGRLALEGIDAFLHADDSIFPNTEIEGVGVMVRAEDLERAKEALSRIEPLPEGADTGEGLPDTREARDKLVDPEM